ncbi:H-NS family nucleoid-associated regulatory protein [Rubellimicrobium aerolatum]|uniref:H-NS family nucleoid-associated regulatory protein n=1 Tax=Rubellimicrobium aerolatum TaxID=490979 RepID=A0ABW0S9P0_9RHOB|nr:H-NS histone family protein [Rubellimicrobium aerolatum]MBP1804963.1 DNA-binding protein H-NS [Rubellimicrobium aerolatum]
MTDYENMSRRELVALRANIDKAIATAGDRDKRNALRAAEEAARNHGFSLADLMPLMTQAKPRRGRPAEEGGAPRYRNPDNPDQTWSGRGRRPRWIHEAEAAGRPLEDLRAD